jgi:hypothetical protein
LQRYTHFNLFYAAHKNCPSAAVANLICRDTDIFCKDVKLLKQILRQKILNAQQAKTIYRYRNIQEKLLRTNAAIWFNKRCRTQQLCPKYIHIRGSGSNKRSQKTKQQATTYRINQEIKLLYKKKQYLNQQLYHLQIEGASKWQQLWNDILDHILDETNQIMNEVYKKLNKKKN